MTERKTAAWLDENDRLMTGAAKLLGASVFHMMHDSETDSLGMIHTFESTEQLVMVLKHCVKRIESGDHCTDRNEITL